MDFIKITGLKILAHHGVFQEEKSEGQDFFINAKCYYDMKKASKTDDLQYAMNYAEICEYMTEVFTSKSYDLIEAAAENLCESLLKKFQPLVEIDLELRKPHAPIGLSFEDVSVNISRKWNRAYLSFGSNMGDRYEIIEKAIKTIKECDNIRNVKISSLIETKPYGPVEQEDFINGCMEIETLYNAEELLEYLHQVEQQADRKREIHWGPRTLDLDIVFFNKEVYESEDLIIPHVDMENRYFVLKPLCNLCPNFRHPVLNRTIQQLYDGLKEKE